MNLLGLEKIFTIYIDVYYFKFKKNNMLLIDLYF